MSDVVITEFMSQSAVDDLSTDFDLLYSPDLVDRPKALKEALADARAIIVRNRTQVRQELLDQAPNLQVVGRLGVGLDNIDVAACERQGVTVYPATGANDIAVAEYVIATAMLLARGAYSATDQVIAGSWPRQACIGREIQGQVLGLIGCGNIARETAKRAKALGMSAIAHDPYDDCSQSGRPSRSNKMTDYVLSPADAQNLIVSILKRHETSTANALHVAKALVAAEIDGQRGHGLSRVPSYAAQSASGKVDGRAVPVVAGRKSGAVRIDAANGFAYPALDLAISELTTLTKETGIAAASVFRSHHFGQAGYHAERLAENGLVALVFGNSPKAIAPWGGSKGLFGTNPIAFAAPRSNSPPLLIDLSLSKVARGKVMVAQQKGEPIPEGWALDENGQSTTDPTAALKGTMLPMGEAKGAALVLMVEILAAGLSGAHFGYEATSFFTADGPSPGVGQLILAFDPESLSGGSFSSRLEELISEILTQDNVRLPGTRRIALRQKAQHDGIRIPSDLFSELNALNQR